MEICRNKQEEYLFAKLKQLIRDSGDSSFTKDADYLFEDDHLMAILRCKKMRTDGAFEAVKKIHHIFTHKYPGVFKRFHPEILQHALATPGFGPLRHRNETGSHILVAQAKHWKVSECSLEDLILTCIMIGFEMSMQIQTQENGMIMMISVEGLSFSQARQVTPFLIKKAVDIIFHSLPMRFTAIHFTSINPVFQVPLSIIKMFFPAKLKERLHLHSNLETLHKHFPPEILPQEFGGILTDKEAYDYNIVNSLLSPQVMPLYDNIKLLAKRDNGK